MQRLAVLLLLAVLAPAVGAQAVSPDRSDWRVAAGAGVETVGDTTLARLSVGYLRSSRWRLAEWLVVSPRWEASAGYWTPNPTRVVSGDAMGSASLRLILQAPISKSKRWFYEVGSGVMYISDTEAVDGVDWGNRIQFDSHVGVGYYLDRRRRWDVIYQFHHASNASRSDVNPGIDFHFLQLGYRY